MDSLQFWRVIPRWFEGDDLLTGTLHDKGRALCTVRPRDCYRAGTHASAFGFANDQSGAGRGNCRRLTRRVAGVQAHPTSSIESERFQVPARDTEPGGK